MRSYSINELYEATPNIGSAESLTINPLISDGALNEAEFIDVRLSPQRSRVGVIFEIQGIGFGASNTALVVLTGVGKLNWSNDDTRQRSWRARRGDWTPTISTWIKTPEYAMGSDLWALDASDVSSAATALPGVDEILSLPEYVLEFSSFTVTGLRADMYIGHVDGLGDSPPDMGELSDTDIIAGFPQWSSVMHVHGQYTYPDA